jgi:hypothetical protein
LTLACAPHPGLPCCKQSTILPENTTQPVGKGRVAHTIKPHPGACKPHSKRGGSTPPEVEAAGTDVDGEQHRGDRVARSPA